MGSFCILLFVSYFLKGQFAQGEVAALKLGRTTSRRGSSLLLKLGVTLGPGLCLSTCSEGPIFQLGFPDGWGWVLRQVEPSNTR